MLSTLWKRRTLGPDEYVHARKARGSRIKVCEISDWWYDGYFMRTVLATARHWFGLDIKLVDCPKCRERLGLPCL